MNPIRWYSLFILYYIQDALEDEEVVLFGKGMATGASLTFLYVWLAPFG